MILIRIGQCMRNVKYVYEAEKSSSSDEERQRALSNVDTETKVLV